MVADNGQKNIEIMVAQNAQDIDQENVVAENGGQNKK